MYGDGAEGARIIVSQEGEASRVSLTFCSAYATYIMRMLTVHETEVFSAWMSKLRDARGKAKIAARIDRLGQGNPGDVAPVGQGVNELRIHFGPGYRVYFVRRGEEIVILLCGGDKSTQTRDINLALKIAASLED